MFAAGAAVGSAVTWKIVKTRYERIVQEEIESVKDAFTDMMAIQKDSDEDADDESDTIQVETEVENSNEEDEYEYEPTEADLNEYTRLAGTYTNEKGGADIMTKEPYVISPYDFGEIDGYNQIELTYYADDTLEDDEGNVITDRDKLIGPKALYTFGEYEDDSVFVRNEHLCTDFQILKDYRTYAEARSIGPDRV
jgi:hypothetical protein